jgi:hypothetical protein
MEGTTMHQTYDTPGPVAVSLQVALADIEVDVHDAPTTELAISGYDKEAPPRVSVQPASGGGSRVTIEHKTKKFWVRAIGRGLEIRMTVPRDTSIEGSGGATELEARGRLASLSFRTGSGEIRFEDVTGDVRLACASGDIEGGSVGGHLMFKGASGDIEVGAIAGGATVRSASGDISIGRLDGPSTITVGSGDIELREVGPGTVNVRAISGDVKVGVREGLGVWMDVSSTSGDVTSALETARRADADPAGPELELTLNTVSGDVGVARARTKV